MNFLFEYLREVLLEGRYDDLKKQYPDIDVEYVWELDPSSTKKYVRWMLKQIQKSRTDGKFVDVRKIADDVVFFHTNNKKFRFKNKDINSYATVDDLHSEVERVRHVGPTKTALKRIASSGAVKLFENDIASLYKILTKEAAVALGRGKKWCITMANQKYYENYTKAGTYFYYIIKKQPEGRVYDKVAIAIVKPAFKIEGTEIYDSLDNRITDMKVEYEFEDEKFLEIPEQDALKMPAQLKHIVKSGKELTESQAAEFWKSLDNDDAKFMALRKTIPESSYKYFLPVVEEKFAQIIENYEPYYGNLFALKEEKQNTDLPSRIGPDGYKEWLVKGKRHRLDGPALVTNDTTAWYVDGLLQSINGQPALVEKYSNKTAWFDKGELHREDGPAKIIKDPNGDLAQQEWYKHGELHRDDGPASILYKNGHVIKQKWYLDGLYADRGNKPNVISYYQDKNQIFEEKWMNAEQQLSRNDGPALIQYFPNGKRQREEYYKSNTVLRRIWYNENGEIEEEWSRE